MTCEGSTQFDNDCQVKNLVNYKINPKFVERLGVKASYTNEVPVEELNKCGVYFISFNGAEKFYIGSTTQNLGQRRKEHFNELCSGRHKNIILTHAFNKYGGQMTFEVIESFDDISREDLRAIEQTYLDKYMRRVEIYNVNPMASGGGAHKFTDDQVFDIFCLRSKGFSNIEIAEIYGCYQDCIARIISRKSYKWVKVPKRYLLLIEDLPVFKNGYRHSVKVDCLKLRIKGMSFVNIAKEVNLRMCSAESLVKNFSPRNDYEADLLKSALSVNLLEKRNIGQDELSEMRVLKDSGVPVAEIAEKYGYSVGGLHNKFSDKYQEYRKNYKKK